jgi:hypothetical protein
MSDNLRAARLLSWLADARDEYATGARAETAESIQNETATARHLARILRNGPDAAWGWLPSWQWDTYAALVAQADQEVTDTDRLAATDEAIEALLAEAEVTAEHADSVDVHVLIDRLTAIRAAHPAPRKDHR